MDDNNRLVDSYGRRVTNLRISLTDRCNFQCVYCTPAEGFPLTPKSGFLDLADIVRLVRVVGRDRRTGWRGIRGRVGCQ